MAPYSSSSLLVEDFRSIGSTALGRLNNINELNLSFCSTLMESFVELLGSRLQPLCAWACIENRTDPKSIIRVFAQFISGGLIVKLE